MIITNANEKGVNSVDISVDEIKELLEVLDEGAEKVLKSIIEDIDLEPSKEVDLDQMILQVARTLDEQIQRVYNNE